MATQVWADVDWGMAMAAVVMTIVPPLIVLLILQEQFMRGFGLVQEKLSQGQP